MKTLYDSEDLYDLLEILSVRNWNATFANRGFQEHTLPTPGG
ncbi:hypothetical protein AmDm5_1932 [Acetobacter malorum]|nr:hypothetical protein AmDm5_1932 [Acetobacter malorum]